MTAKMRNNMFVLFSYFIIAVITLLIVVLLQQYHFAISFSFAHTNITFNAISACLLLYLTYIVYRILRIILLSPWNFVQYRRDKNKKLYVDLLGQALSAYLIEDDIKIKTLVSKLNHVSKHKNSPYLKTLHQTFFPLLTAKNFEITGQEQKAHKIYENLEMDSSSTQKLLGLHNLYEKAKEENDFEACVNYAREAFKYSSGMRWANDTLLSYSIVNKDWGGAIEIFKLIEKFGNKHLCINKQINLQKAVMFAAQAQNNIAKDIELAKNYAKSAYNLIKTHVGINALYAMLLLRTNEERDALLLLEHWWKKKPHPDYAKLYLYCRNLSKEQRLENAKHLAALNEKNIYSLLYLSEAYFENNNSDKALEYVNQAIAVEPLHRCYLQLHAIEQSAYQVADNIYDYAWVGDNLVLPYWQPLSPTTKSFNGVVWQKIAIKPELKMLGNYDERYCLY